MAGVCCAPLFLSLQRGIHLILSAMNRLFSLSLENDNKKNEEEGEKRKKFRRLKKKL